MSMRMHIVYEHLKTTPILFYNTSSDYLSANFDFIGISHDFIYDKNIHDKC